MNEKKKTGFARVSAFLFAALLVCLASGCGLWGVGQWSAYTVKLQVHGQNGQAIQGVEVSTLNQPSQLTNEKGEVVLYYSTKGLYVITLSKAGWETTQIKVNMPVDTGREMFLQLLPLIDGAPAVAPHREESQ